MSDFLVTHAPCPEDDDTVMDPAEMRRVDRVGIDYGLKYECPKCHTIVTIVFAANL